MLSCTQLSKETEAPVVFILRMSDVFLYWNACLSASPRLFGQDKHPSRVWFRIMVSQPSHTSGPHSQHHYPPFPWAMWLKQDPQDWLRWPRTHAVGSRWLNAQSQLGAILRAWSAFCKDLVFVVVCWYDTMMGNITKINQGCVCALALFGRLLGCW